MANVKGMNPAALGALVKGDVKNLIVASTPGGIENQEKEGQEEFVASETLPKRYGSGTTKEQCMYLLRLKKFGIKFTVGKDAGLFMKVVLPKGWKKIPTAHSMWSKLLNEKGKVMGEIFYKAAFYDENAFIRFVEDK